MSNRHTTVDTPLGVLTLVAEGGTLTGVFFPDHWHRPARAAFGTYVDLDTDRLLREAGAQLTAFLSGERTGFDLPTRTNGGAFEERIWAMLRDIPYGQTTTYGDLAARLGDRSLARAVGRAVGRNPLSVVIPCHRVVGTEGRLTGYAGGLVRKRFLLQLEAPAAVPAGTLF